MYVYFSPLACSLASRIVAYEAGLDVTFDRVDNTTGRTASDQDYRAINPIMQVPALRTDEGVVLTENAAILQYLGDRRPEAGLAPGGFARYELQRWLSFISAELHSKVFTPLLGSSYPDAAKTKAREVAASRFALLNDHLTGRDWLLDDFSVADAYLAAVLNWNRATQFDFGPYPALQAYQARLATRPAVGKAVAEELALYQAA